MKLEQIIPQLGKRKDVANLIGCTITVLNIAVSRNKLPIKYWEKFLDLCETRGIKVSVRELIQSYNHKLPT